MTKLIRWMRVRVGYQRSRCGNHEVWCTLAYDEGDTWNARSFGVSKYNLGYLVTAKQWCEKQAQKKENGE